MQVQARRRPMPPDASMSSAPARPPGNVYGAGPVVAPAQGTTYGRGAVYGQGDGRGPGAVYGQYGGRPERPGDDPTPPKTKTKVKRKRKDPLWARLVMILGALLMVTSGAAVAGSKMLIGRYTESISQQNLLGTAAKKPAGGKALEGAINILMLGVDERSRNPGDVRSDTIIVLHIPASHDQAYLVSMPRDTFVDVPAFEPSKYGGGRTKITDAFYFGSRNGAGRAGGAQLVAQIINKMTGIEFDGAAIIDFRGFKRVIDAMGGVDMCVDHAVKSAHMRRVGDKVMYLDEARDHGGGVPVEYEEGCRHMKGWEALDYSRQRYGLPKGDYDRQRHQQQLIKSMAKGAMSKGMITDLGKLDRVIKAAGDAFILDTGGVPIADFIFTMKGVAANDLVLVKTNAGNFNSAHLQGTSAEALSEESLEMFAAVGNGSLAGWLIDHPAYISKEK